VRGWLYDATYLLVVSSLDLAPLRRGALYLNCNKPNDRHRGAEVTDQALAAAGPAPSVRSSNLSSDGLDRPGSMQPSTKPPAFDVIRLCGPTVSAKRR